MAYKLACADTGAKCPFVVITEKKEELVQHVGVHAQFSHPEMAKTPPPPGMIEQLIKVV
jgi:predicted small metal-binding protein